MLPPSLCPAQAIVVAGTNEAATTSAFGVIFSDVDVAGDTRIDFFDQQEP